MVNGDPSVRCTVSDCAAAMQAKTPRIPAARTQWCFSIEWLVFEPQGKLQDARVAGARDPHEVGVGDRAVRVREIHVVEQVESLEAELDLHAFADREVLVQAVIQVKGAGTAIAVPSEN